MSISLVHNASTYGSMNPSPTTFNLTVTAPANGNVMVLAMAAPTAASLTSLSLTNVIWTPIATQASNFPTVGYTLYLYIGVVLGTGGTTISATFSSTTSAGDSVILQAAEFSGVAMAYPVDAFSANAQTGIGPALSYTCSTGTVATSYASDLVVAFLTNILSGPGTTLGAGPTSGFTSINTQTTAGPADIATQLCYQVETATGTYSTTQNFSCTTSDTGYCQSIIAALRPASGGGESLYTALPHTSPGIGIGSL